MLNQLFLLSSLQQLKDTSVFNLSSAPIQMKYCLPFLESINDSIIPFI